MLASLPKHGIQYLISIVMEIFNLVMVAYSEKTLTFTFLMTQFISDDRLSQFKISVSEHLNVLAMLNQEFYAEEPLVIQSRFVIYYDPTSQVSVLNYSVPIDSFHIQALRIISKLVHEEFQSNEVQNEAQNLESVSLLSDDIVNEGIRSSNAFPAATPSKVYREGTRIFVAY